MCQNDKDAIFLLLICTGRDHPKFPGGTDLGVQNVIPKERRGAPKVLDRIRTSVRFLWRWSMTAVCECISVVAQTLSYPAQLATQEKFDFLKVAHFIPYGQTSW
jgi:hypothetical protein